MVFPTFFNLSLHLAIRSSWSEPQSAPGLVFASRETQNKVNRSEIGWDLWPFTGVLAPGQTKELKARVSEKHLLYWLHQSLCVDHNKLWKIFQEMGIPDHLTCLLRNLYAVKKQQLELDREQQTGSKLGKEYVKAVYRHPAYFTYMQKSSCETVT